ncbi:hypothetical protein [Curvivirga aplysinae]|nr:hypothetical protein [Curvivirga aplysinae]
MFAPAVLIAVIEKAKQMVWTVMAAPTLSPVRVKAIKTTKTTKTRY